ncbi:DinB family protein [Actinobacteria bacterium YIM 96077]|uniref:Mini-circle protein n=1 Tax=Phytoactinopolyspora halophila TaxID=1981511 RepID=A0A329QAA7_9ACTN|nr:DinB family protein [Phytoactinopolyspora halophila]AYY12452.1 DinB family protein [Actinobacteria bacterium YIM 96077]RAW09266.1 Mini-circle protein [Phytoactinopolyspora halophila]
MDDLAEPSHQLSDPQELLLGYLDYYRSAVARKLHGLPEAELRTSRLPSGWTPLQLVNHLLYMERRWLRWGFVAEHVDAPWGDIDEDDRWYVSPDATAAELVARLDEAGERTRAIAEAADLDDLAALGGRFQTDADRPTLAWTLFHVLQEYARHAGHLDVARELADGQLGE